MIHKIPELYFLATSKYSNHLQTLTYHTASNVDPQAACLLVARRQCLPVENTVSNLGRAPRGVVEERRCSSKSDEGAKDADSADAHEPSASALHTGRTCCNRAWACPGNEPGTGCDHGRNNEQSTAYEDKCAKSFDYEYLRQKTMRSA